MTQVPGQIVDQFATGVRAIGSYPHKITELWGTVFEGKKRDPNGAIGVVGIGRIGGEISQSTVLNVQDKVFSLISLLAGVNLLLFLFNLLPLLPLDGGHVAGAMVEAAQARPRSACATGPGPAGTPVRPPPPVRRSSWTPRRCCR